jgi:hypothetical protein
MRIVGHKSEKMHKRFNSVPEADLKQAAKQLDSYLSNTCHQSCSQFEAMELIVWWAV